MGRRWCETNSDCHHRRGRDFVVLLLTAAVMSASLAARPACSADDPSANPFPGRFPAPSLEGGVEWLNTTGEISLKELRGKVVVLDFWTYCCINCMHILPDLKYLEEKYRDQLVVIGVHAAKFDNEKDTENIRRAILRYDIEHPVVNDANMVIARKYHFSSWPTLVIIDPEGNYVGQQPGEGTRALMDTVVGRLVSYHRAKGTLDETPVRFVLERARVEPTPLKFPGKLLIDAPNDRLYVSDSNHNRIVISTLAGKLVDVVGNGQIGAVDGDFETATFDHPQGMTLIHGNLYVADTENHLIRMVDLAHRTVSRSAGTGKQASAHLLGGAMRETALNSPWALAEANGTMFVAMAGPHQIWAHRLGAGRIEAFAGNGMEDIIDGPRTNASLAQPSGITTNGTSLFFVDSEGSAVRALSLDDAGFVSTIAGAHDLPSGRTLFEFGDVDGIGNNARLQHPLGITYSKGGLYVADTYNHKIKHVDLATRNCTTWLGTGERGKGLDPVQLSEPADMAILGDEMIVADTNNHRLLRVDMNTKKAQEFVIEGLTPPAAVKIDSAAEDMGIELTRLEPQAVRSADHLTVELTTELPDGFKLNPLAPQLIRLKTQEPQTLVSDDNLEVKLEGEADGNLVRWSIPLAGQTGSATFELKVSYSYCRDGTGGVCKFGTARWEIPIRIASDASATAVSLKVTPPQ